MNEEEIRGKLLLPFLEDLGFDNSELFLETSFSIRLGKTNHTIKGRSDILCKKNSKNLFIIELKNDSIAIKDNDIEQGISYARALDEIAPFTIITNGKITRIFDTISKKELTGKNISEESDYWNNGFTLSTDEELKIRYEALKKFISFSPENLRLFCEKQVLNRMGPIIGSVDDPTSKFVKELYCNRPNLLFDFNDFLNSEAKAYSIVGSAGVGKTNAICSLALQTLESNFVFFYNASIINKSPLEHIAQDLNVVFSGKSTSDLVLKKLDEIGLFINKNIVIFIDAIDESRNADISLELSEMSLACRNLTKVKICISCKTSIWEKILKINGTHTHLFEELNKFHISNTPGFLLEDFNDVEFNTIIPLYKKTFKFKGQISDELQKDLRNGFFLRIFSEVYKDCEVPDKVNDKDLIKTYLRKSLEKTELGIISGLRILSKIGNIIINQSYTSLETYKDEGLDVNNLLDKLELSDEEQLPEELFARNILIRSNKEDSYNINFYYSKIRDYIICFHTFKLDQLTDNDFYNLLTTFYENYIGQSAIDFYISNASSSHKHTLIRFKKAKALEYVINYDNYLEENFKKFKKLFDPRTTGNIGIVLPRDLINGDGYALCHLDTNFVNRVQLEDLTDPFSDLNRDDFIKRGVNSVFGSNSTFLIADQSKIIKQNIFKQLDEVVRKRKLTTYKSDIFLQEQMSVIIYYYNKKLGYKSDINDFHLPRYDLIYPINLQELKDRLYKIRASFHYTNRKGFSAEKVEEKVENAFINNLEIPKLYFGGDIGVFEELSEIVNILLERGHQEFSKHHLPYADKTVDETKKFYKRDMRINFNRVRIIQYSRDQAKLYINTFFKQLESAYKAFVEDNFPTLKHQFKFYNDCPHEYFFYMKDLDILKWGTFGIRPSKSGEIKVFYSENATNSVIGPRSAFEEDDISILRPFSLDDILYFDSDRTNTSKVEKFSILRNWIYKILDDDMALLFKENKRK